MTTTNSSTLVLLKAHVPAISQPLAMMMMMMMMMITHITRLTDKGERRVGPNNSGNNKANTHSIDIHWHWN